MVGIVSATPVLIYSVNSDIEHLESSHQVTVRCQIVLAKLFYHPYTPEYQCGGNELVPTLCLALCNTKQRPPPIEVPDFQDN